MARICVLFDIDELEGGLYGYEAYKIFFAALDSREIAGCMISDGDTSATLLGRSHQYCIAVDGPPEMLEVVKKALGKFKARGLLPPNERFEEDPQAGRQPLVTSCYVGGQGQLLNCSTSWVTAAWEKAQESRSKQMA